jgi:hypothetical protein
MKENMIKLKPLLCENELKHISLNTAITNKMFGPVYHGTSQDKLEKIGQEGFKVFVGNDRSGDVTNGFETSNYSGGIPAPIHMLGFGVYFTTVRAIAQQFAGGTSSGLKAYFLDVPHLETINFGSPNNMMKWWIKNGYDYKVTLQTTFFGLGIKWDGMENNLPLIQEERFRATKHLTEELRSRYDAVWYKGKGIRRLLDGDQVCVYNPANIYVMDKSLIKPGELGSKVRRKSDGMIGIIASDKDDISDILTKYPGASNWLLPNAKYRFQVKWNKGGTQSVQDVEVEPYIKK